MGIEDILYINVPSNYTDKEYLEEAFKMPSVKISKELTKKFEELNNCDGEVLFADSGLFLIPPIYSRTRQVLYSVPILLIYPDRSEVIFTPDLLYDETSLPIGINVKSIYELMQYETLGFYSTPFDRKIIQKNKEESYEPIFKGKMRIPILAYHFIPETFLEFKEECEMVRQKPNFGIRRNNGLIRILH